MLFPHVKTFEKEKVHNKPFTVDEIRGGILKDFLTDADYLAPYEVTIYFHYSCPFPCGCQNVLPVSLFS